MTAVSALRGILVCTAKRAVVTGATSAIGLAIAQAFFDAPASVVVVSNNDVDAGQRVAGALSDEGGRAIGIPCHGGSRTDWAALVDAVVIDAGPVISDGSDTDAKPS